MMIVNRWELQRSLILLVELHEEEFDLLLDPGVGVVQHAGDLPDIRLGLQQVHEDEVGDDHQGGAFDLRIGETIHEAG